MTTTLNIDLAYDASQATVFAMLTDPTFRERVCDAQGASRRSVDIGGAPLEIHIERTQPTAGAPAVAKRLVPTEVTVEQHEVWSTETAAVLDITTTGNIAEIRGHTALSESAGRTTQTVHLSIKVSVPLVGGRLEALVKDLMEKAYRAEHEIGVAYLATR